MKASLFIFLAFTLISTAQASECISREDAAKNLVTYFANTEYVDLLVDSDYRAWLEKHYPQFQKIILDVQHSGTSNWDEGDTVVRIYGKDVRKMRDTIYQEILNEMLPHLEMPWPINLGWSGYGFKHEIYVHCNGRVVIDPQLN